MRAAESIVRLISALAGGARDTSEHRERHGSEDGACGLQRRHDMRRGVVADHGPRKGRQRGGVAGNYEP